ncbi:PQQ-binding-like beta-propeller repeat protein [Halogeometricum luteum]|uniref:PQQ-like beta-propeller repeat protein n=1 Tax=Halogeometricum luteum TaxID=2950537 RepID=A0ABU2G2I0_9EURY|nr:PQQ-binding-like beta-propeller repeat protein [Halogeometricum sp. S3BR5-2]MDS0294986.1 PQQ-like beta-propeller repeat protein [Halogeometricum sp. S3BR5-2]
MPSRRSFLATGGTLAAGAFAGCIDSLLAQSPAGTQWSASVPAPTSLSPPVTTNGLLAVGGYRDGRLENGRLTVFDAASGTRRWEVDLGRMTGLTAANGRVYVGEKGGPRGARARIRAFDAASGEQLWTRGVSNLASALTVANDTLYAANGSLVALETSDGTRRWERTSVDGLDFTVVVAPEDQLAADEAAVYFGDRGGIVALAHGDGAPRWVARPDDWSTATVGPLPVGGRVYVGAEGTVASLDRTTGDLQWRTSFGSDARVQGFHRAGSSLLVAEATTNPPSGTFGTLYELSVDDGAERYETRFDAPVTQTASTEGLFVVGVDTGSLTWFRNISFVEESETTLPTERYVLGAGEERVFAQSTDGTLYALSQPP